MALTFLARDNRPSVSQWRDDGEGDGNTKRGRVVFNIKNV